jgi:hypothetical protein
VCLVVWLLFPLQLASAPGAGSTSRWHEGFDEGRLDRARWSVTAEGDFKERTVDVVNVGRKDPPDFRLRIRADTRGTRDDSVKFLGVRTVEKLPIRDGTRIEVTLDWNDQANGSYLSAGVIFTPETTNGNPLENRDWLKVEYVGVPPGRNGRLAVSESVGGRERALLDEGWPEANRSGRRISVQRLLLSFSGSALEIRENDRLLDSLPLGTDLQRVHLHLQVSSHSNYPPREVFFDDVQVRWDRDP